MPIISHATPHESLNAVAHALSEIRDPWARHWLLMPGKGRAQWCLEKWAHISGIASRSQTLHVRALVELAAGGHQAQVFQSDALLLAVAESMKNISGLPLPKTIALDHIDGRHITWAKQLSDAIDMGYLCRLEKDRFAHAPFLSELCEQKNITDILRNHIGFQSDQDFTQAAGDWIQDWEHKGGFPHLWLQLDVALPQVLMQRLMQLLTMVENIYPERVHLYLIEPSPHYWGDLRTSKRIWKDDQNAGPLLTAFGRRLQDLQNVSIDLDWDVQQAHAETEISSCPDTLLARLQYSCQVADGDEDLRAPRTDNDHSFSVHACRSPLRELEVCRDRILQAMHESDIKPEEILLLLADPTTYAPFVGAALQSQDDTQQHIPIHLLGLQGTVPSLLAEGIQLIVQCFNERFSQEQFIALIEHPLIAERFQLNTAMSEGNKSKKSDDILSWIQDAGFRWGIDSAERQNYHSHEHAYTSWSCVFALQRLALGAIVDPAQRDHISNGVAALDRAHGLQVQTLAQLALLLDTLGTSKTQWLGNTSDAKNADEHSASIGEWCERLETLIETFFAEGERNDVQQRSHIINSILPQFKRLAADTLISASAFQRLLRTQLDTLSENFHSGAGGVSVAPLQTHAGTPARMILICGLGSENFPRNDDRPDWHPLADTRLRGDPSMRDDDRHNILLSLLSAQERLVCSYIGGSDSDDKIRPPSTALADVLYAAEKCLPLVAEYSTTGQSATGQSATEKLCFTHGLNGFSPQAHQKNDSPTQRSFIQQDFSGALLLNGDPTSKTKQKEPMHGPWSKCLQAEDIPHELHLRDLKYLCENPSRLFAKNLGLFIEDHESTAEHGDLLEIDKLTEWKLRDRLMLQRLRRHIAGDSAADSATNTDTNTDTAEYEDAFFERLRCAGDIPPGVIGQELWENIQARTPTPTHDTALKILHIPESIQFQDHIIQLNDPMLWAIDHQQHVHFFTASKFTASISTGRGKNKITSMAYSTALMRASLGALLVAHSGDIDISVIHVHYNNGTATETHCIHLRPEIIASTETIEKHILRLIQLYSIARALPLAIDKYICDALLQANTCEQGIQEAEKKWYGDNFGGAPGASKNALLRLCFRGLDEPCTWLGPDALDPDQEYLCEHIAGILTNNDTGTGTDNNNPAPIIWRYTQTLKKWMQDCIIDTFQEAEGTQS